MSIINIKIPDIEDELEGATIIRWFFKEGDFIKEEEDLVEIELNKITTIVKAPASGILKKIFTKEGDVITKEENIGQIIIGEANKTLNRLTKGESIDLKEKENSNDRIKASPIVKKIAKEEKIDLSKIKGSGPCKRIVLKDLQSINDIYSSNITIENYEETKYQGIQKKVGDRLLFSKTHIPHYYLTISINMKKSLDVMKNLNKYYEQKITINDWIVFTTSRIIQKYKYINYSVVDDRILQYKNINIGIAMSLDNNLFVPVIKKVNLKNITQIAEESKTLMKQLKNDTLQQESLQNGTFTVSNLGMYNIEEFKAIINPHETAILAIGTIIKKPWVVYEENIEKIDILPIMKISLSVDHRMINGAQAAIFLNSLKNTLENPEQILLLENENAKQS
ncbi:MAG: dihydrolipoamide acetyltransferase family protein [Eubacteriaceae bacterium]